MKITLNKLEQLYRSGYSLDIVFFLKMIQEGSVIGEVCEGNPKLEALYQSLIRKGLITEKDELTITGEALLKFLNTKETVKLVKKSNEPSVFDQWWTAYPATDTFKYKNKTFYGTRSLKANKEECKIKIEAILNEKEYTLEMLIKALQFEVIQKKENSIKTGTNRLTYMQNSLTYLNQRTYESFVDLIKEGISSEPKGDYDGINV
jgi:hypothetical protein